MAKSDPFTIILGGPSYQMLTDARHTASMVELALLALTSGIAREVATSYQHGCPVEVPRNKLFAQALASEATHLIWADSDCYWTMDADGKPQTGHSNGLLWICQELDKQGLPFCGVPVAQRNGAANVVTSRDGEKFHRLKDAVKMEPVMRACVAIGLGLAVFYLPWYRRHWPEGPHFRTEWEGGSSFVSEDFWHCLRLGDLAESRHGLRHCRPRWAPVVAVTHGARGVNG